ncbi:MAG: hypothetical protein R6X05_08480 [Desulfobacterales bacterium]
MPVEIPAEDQDLPTRGAARLGNGGEVVGGIDDHPEALGIPDTPAVGAHLQHRLRRSSKVGSRPEICALQRSAFFITRWLETLAVHQILKFCETAIEKLVPLDRR